MRQIKEEILYYWETWQSQPRDAKNCVYCLVGGFIIGMILDYHNLI
jgi:hypothetical protein